MLRTRLKLSRKQTRESPGDVTYQGTLSTKEAVMPKRLDVIRELDTLGFEYKADAPLGQLIQYLKVVRAYLINRDLYFIDPNGQQPRQPF